MVGNLTRDIDLRYTQTGMAIAKTAIATNRRFKTQTGEQKEETCFIDITLFGRAAEVANQYLGKGSKVLIDGRLVYEQWTDAQGNKRSKHSIAVENLQMLGFGREETLEPPSTKPLEESKDSPKTEPNKPLDERLEIDDDEIPF